ncbi:DUF5687 family protein [Labilibacter marinus]|uniref:DUF5687 family protein n=1 Tax=Labilibacter marinus TaxID=1477105 RepID=UPI00082A39B7|nr:DUF5687 family protein [Labilibacter marinus]
MASLLYSLNRKSFYRSAHWQQSVGIKAVVIFFSVYLSAVLLTVGFNIPSIFKQFFPSADPVILFNQFVWGYFLISALMRQLVQSLPVVDTIPLLSLPFKKRKIAQYVVNKSFISFLNLTPWFIVLPFAFTVLSKQFTAISVSAWVINLLGFVLIDHLTAILVKRSAPSKQRTIMILYVIGIIVFVISYFEILPVAEWFGNYLLLVLEKPFLAIIPLVTCVPLYLINIKSITESLYLDSGILPTEKEQSTYSFDWTNKFGQMGTYLALELKMITRNKRPKTALFSVIFLLCYGFIVYGSPQNLSKDFMLVLVGLFVTGSFSISYGQFTPAWHAQYYSFINTRNFGLKEMLNTQYFLFIATTILAYIFSTIYLMYGAKILMVNAVMAIFNIGFTSHIVLWMGSYSSKPIDLSRGSFMNYQGTGASQWVMSFIIILPPIILFAVLNAFIGANWAYAIFTMIGVLGIIFHGLIMDKVMKRYQDNKHRMLFAYKQ